MLGRSTGAVLVGLEAHLVEVEVDQGRGLPSISAVGLPNSAVREGIERIRAAIRHGEFQQPAGRVTINLAPADVRKEGGGLDLPMATAILLGSGQIDAFDSASVVLAGELALDGTLRPVPGALSIAIAARRAGRRTLLVPRANVDEAALVEGVDVIAVSSLADVAAFARGVRPVSRIDGAALLREARSAPDGRDLCEVRGQASARRALEVAAAGGHHLLLSGPPGGGKTMLASRLPGILPPLTLDEALDVTRVWSAAGLCQGLVARRPFRAPHHGISFAGLTGGGRRLRPGEISLATHGVLFLDEMTEFRRDALEALRQPLEEGSITVVRVHASATLPAAFMLVASMNPCRCGWYGAPDGRCDCTPLEVRRYRSRLSGPLLDRFDLAVEVPPLDLRSLASSKPGETSLSVRRRVERARRIQRRRLGRKGSSCNARMGPVEMERHAVLDPAGRQLLLGASERLGLSARGFDRVRRVARTLADLDGVDAIEPPHVAEAIQYRHPEALGRG